MHIYVKWWCRFSPWDSATKKSTFVVWSHLCLRVNFLSQHYLLILSNIIQSSKETFTQVQDNHSNYLFFQRFFGCGPFFKVFIESATMLLLLHVPGPEACGIPVALPGTKPTSPAPIRRQSPIIGPPGKSTKNVYATQMPAEKYDGLRKKQSTFHGRILYSYKRYCYKQHYVYILTT